MVSLSERKQQNFPAVNKNSAVVKLEIHLGSKLYPTFEEESDVTWWVIHYFRDLLSVCRGDTAICYTYYLYRYNLMAELGGVIGLWIGASCAGLLEFAYFLCIVLPRQRFCSKKKEENEDGWWEPFFHLLAVICYLNLYCVLNGWLIITSL